MSASRELLPIEDPTPTSLVRQLEQSDIRCPAGSCVGEAGVLCAVEQHVIDGRTSTTSVSVFCMGSYTECPSWRAQRDFEREQGGLDLLGAMRGPDREHGKAERDARLRAAAEMLSSNKAESRAARLRLGMTEWVD